MMDVTKEKRYRTELRFHLEMPEGAAPQDFPREIDVKTVKMLGWCAGALTSFKWFSFCRGTSREAVALPPNHRAKCADYASHVQN